MTNELLLPFTLQQIHDIVNFAVLCAYKYEDHVSSLLSESSTIKTGEKQELKTTPLCYFITMCHFIECQQITCKMLKLSGHQNKVNRFFDYTLSQGFLNF
jgi:hypothetical protein